MVSTAVRARANTTTTTRTKCSTITATLMLLLLHATIVCVLSSLPTASGRAVQLHFLRQIVDECRNETKAVEADFEALMSKDVAIGRTAKCLRACLMKKINALEIADTFNKEMVMSIAKESAGGSNVQKINNISGIFELCIELQVSEDHCEAAEQYGKCASDHLESHK